MKKLIAFILVTAIVASAALFAFKTPASRPATEQVETVSQAAVVVVRYNFTGFMDPVHPFTIIDAITPYGLKLAEMLEDGNATVYGTLTQHYSFRDGTVTYQGEQAHQWYDDTVRSFK